MPTRRSCPARSTCTAASRSSTATTASARRSPATIGNVPDQINAMDFNPATGVLYGIEDARVGPTPAPVRDYFLVTIDKTTGVGTRIGPALDGAAALAWRRPADAAPRAEIRARRQRPARSPPATRSPARSTTPTSASSPRAGQAIVKTFTIRNTGLAPLNLSGAVQVVGANPARLHRHLAAGVDRRARRVDDVPGPVPADRRGTRARRPCASPATTPTSRTTTSPSAAPTRMLVVTLNGQPVSDDFQINIGTIALGGSDGGRLGRHGGGAAADHDRQHLLAARPTRRAAGGQFVNPPSGLTLQPGQSVPLQIQFLTDVPGDYGDVRRADPAGRRVDRGAADRRTCRRRPTRSRPTTRRPRPSRSPPTARSPPHSCTRSPAAPAGAGSTTPAAATAADEDWATFTLAAPHQRRHPRPRADADERRLAPHRRHGAHALRPQRRQRPDRHRPVRRRRHVRRHRPLRRRRRSTPARTSSASAKSAATRSSAPTTCRSSTLAHDAGRQRHARRRAGDRRRRSPTPLLTGTTQRPDLVLDLQRRRQALSITGFGTTGANAADFLVTVRDAAGAEVTGTSFTIDPGSSFTAEVRFKPTGGGARSAALAFTTNDADEPDVSLAARRHRHRRGLTIQNVTLTGVPRGSSAATARPRSPPRHAPQRRRDGRQRPRHRRDLRVERRGRRRRQRPARSAGVDEEPAAQDRRGVEAAEDQARDPRGRRRRRVLRPRAGHRRRHHRHRGGQSATS